MRKKFLLLLLLLAAAVFLCACEHKHREEIIPAVAATCTTDGATEGVKCAKCDEILAAPQVISGGHKWNDGTVIIEPTCMQEGLLQRKCLNCSERKDEDIESSGHVESDWIVDSDATCKEAGAHHKECTVCKEILRTGAIAAKGHSAVGITCRSCGEYVIELNKLGTPYTDTSGLTVTLHSYEVQEYEGYVAHTIRYTIKNEMPDSKVLPGQFKLLFDDNTMESQYGFFNYLYYGDSDSRIYTWKVLKSQKVLVLEYNADDKDAWGTEIMPDGLHWVK